MSYFVLLEARRRAIDVVFPTTLQADTGVGIGADFTYVLQGALDEDRSLLMTVLMQSERSAAVADARLVPIGP